MRDYSIDDEEHYIGVYNDEAYYEIEGHHYVRRTSSTGGDHRIKLLLVPDLPASLVAA